MKFLNLCVVSVISQKHR